MGIGQVYPSPHFPKVIEILISLEVLVLVIYDCMLILTS